MTIQVTIPYYGCPELVGKCVQSVLDQTERDLICVVIGDGEEPPLDIADSRLVVYTLPENRGPYFAQQVALLACPYEFYAPVGADDWLEPDHLERLLRFGEDAVYTGAVWFHNLHGKVSEHRGSYEVGLFRPHRLLMFGGHNPAERIGQDSLLIHLLRRTGPVYSTKHPTYHRVKRPNSLMTSAETGKGTAARNEMRRRNRLLLADVEGWDARSIKSYRENLVPKEIKAEVAFHAHELASRLTYTTVAA